MKHVMYTIFDAATGAYLRPFVAEADGQATRMFKDIATDPGHDVGRHPKDYTLWRVGIFDNQTAEVISERKECIASALELKSQAESRPAEQAEMLEQNYGGSA